MSSAQRALPLRPQVRPGVRLSELVARSEQGELPEWEAAARSLGANDGNDPLITGVTLDSRLVTPGDLYVALPGRDHHGAQFAADAIAAGALAVLTDVSGAQLISERRAPVITVANPRLVMASVAARIYQHPSAAMTMFGVTGTNGKTTTSFLLDAALRAAGQRTGVIGTIGFLVDGTALDATRTTVTTPESPELQALLAVMVEGGVQACVMEVSSHALALGRVDAITFDVAAFTNFGRDHLDFHGDEESYFESKALLFTPEHTRRAVINIDDPRGRTLVDRLKAAESRPSDPTKPSDPTVAGVPTVTVSLDDPGADYLVTDLRLGADGLTEVSLRAPRATVNFRLALPGDFNVRNAVTALAMVDLCGIDLEQAAAGLAAAAVPGRMQRVDLGSAAPMVFVDFAHTPQAVEAALAAVSGPRRIAVLGCGGDRDPDKRGPIGAAAASGADVVIVTDDNPRSEEPAAIRRQVLDGAQRAKLAGGLGCDIIDGGDRRSAIRLALDLSEPADVLIILGKGHETGQDSGGSVLPFSDVEVVRSEWTGSRALGTQP